MVDYARYRWWLHGVFWLCFTLVFALIKINFAPPSEMEYSPGVRFLRYWLSEISMLPLKLMASYGFLYLILPRYILQKKYLLAIVLSILGVTLLLVLYRLQQSYVTSMVLYGEVPAYNTLELRRILFSLSDFIPVMALAASAKLLRIRMKTARREQELIQEKLQSELNYLRAQTNPHFLFNTLNNIYALARREAPITSQSILKLSQILRFTLYECNNARISLESELKVIRDYIELEKLRYNERLNIQYQENIDDQDVQIAPLLLLPLIENAFKHGASESRSEVLISIDISVQEKVLVMRVVNTDQADRALNPHGIGISNVRRQLELIYPHGHELNLSSSEGMFRVHLIIHLTKDHEEIELHHR